ncbi:hypothetical protein SAJA_14585 [Salinisphaera japonica YTM-1]|uniref:Uncharacterized protein n=1 Tax=Salinisphaera japonica YTM-1 TaxID=1209778 RepID=A0A423PF05_9GAMM|nr:hypothetical protein [Xanthomonadales bacterium]ROO24150.1 hypothetical protein SAJA_14585 [Salinisphaera japonica YTM-1]
MLGDAAAFRHQQIEERPPTALHGFRGLDASIHWVRWFQRIVPGIQSLIDARQRGERGVADIRVVVALAAIEQLQIRGVESVGIGQRAGLAVNRVDTAAVAPPAIAYALVLADPATDPQQSAIAMHGSSTVTQHLGGMRQRRHGDRVVRFLARFLH